MWWGGGSDPGVNVVQPVDPSRLRCNSTLPPILRFRRCSYCTLIHRDPTAQNMYPLTCEQLKGSEIHRESPSELAGLPSTLWRQAIEPEATPGKGE
uniref:Uncharacterized protein n=1 Tax=Toxoplasma gondii (strain ATCC 50861 / VEG) TaxID=432359 RepID=A0A0F7UXJ0_TOXGV|nr:TPA: hypothetical protein BN1205_044800 [Toxoplasma gondii VEG]